MNKNKKGKSNHKARLPFLQLIVTFTLMYESHPFILFPIGLLYHSIPEISECLPVPVRDISLIGQ